MVMSPSWPSCSSMQREEGVSRYRLFLPIPSVKELPFQRFLLFEQGFLEVYSKEKRKEPVVYHVVVTSPTCLSIHKWKGFPCRVFEILDGEVKWENCLISALPSHESWGLGQESKGHRPTRTRLDHLAGNVKTSPAFRRSFCFMVGRVGGIDRGGWDRNL